MAQEGEDKKLEPMKEEEFKLNLKRVNNSATQKDKMIIIKSMYQNYKLTAKQSAALIDCIHESDKKIATAIILAEQFEDEDERKEFAHHVINSYKWEEDKRMMADMLDVEYIPPQPKKEKKKGPKVNQYSVYEDPRFV